MRVPLVPGLRGSSAHRLLPEDLASCRGLPSGLSLLSMLADIGARSTRTLDAVDVDTLIDVAKLRRHPGHSLLRLIVVGGDVLEGRTSDENQLITSAPQSSRTRVVSSGISSWVRFSTEGPRFLNDGQLML